MANISDGKIFDTNVFFSGGAGMFIQYHDIIKPVWLYAIIKMIITGDSYGLPIGIIKNNSILSILEWYQKRRYVNPLRQLDWAHKVEPEVLDKLMRDILKNDSSIYKLSPMLNIERIFYVYRQQHMTFPVYVYSKEEEPYIKEDCATIFQGINFKYLYGDLKDAIQKCEQNFTYIFSDLEMVKEVAEILTGTCSHLLVARDYRYNYTDNFKTFKYDLSELMSHHPFMRIGTTLAMEIERMDQAFANITQGGEE